LRLKVTAGGDISVAKNALFQLTVTLSLMPIFGLYENASGEIDSGMRSSTPRETAGADEA